MNDTTDSSGAPKENPIIRWMTRILDWSAAIVLALLMVLTFADVVGREVFNSPFDLTTDATRLMLAAMVYAVLPAVSRAEAHVGVDLLDRWVPRWFVRPRQVIINLAAAVLFGLVAWQIYLSALEKIEFEERTQFVEWPLYPIFMFMSAMALLTALVLLLNAYLYLTGKRTMREGETASTVG